MPPLMHQLRVQWRKSTKFVNDHDMLAGLRSSFGWFVKMVISCISLLFVILFYANHCYIVRDATLVGA